MSARNHLHTQLTIASSAVAVSLTPATALACGNSMGADVPMLLLLVVPVTGVLAVILFGVFALLRVNTTRAAQLAVGVFVALTGGIVGFESLKVYPPHMRGAESLQRKLADGAKAYFTSEQRFSSRDGQEPWHAGKPGYGAPDSVGMPVPWGGYVFPGGVNYTYNMQLGPGVGPDCARAPSRQPQLRPFATKTFAYYSRTGVDGRPRLDDTSPHWKTFAALGVDLATDDPIGYQVVYQTGPGTGLDATATLTILADFDPEKPGCHTITQELSVDRTTQEVIITPARTTHALH